MLFDWKLFSAGWTVIAYCNLKSRQRFRSSRCSPCVGGCVCEHIAPGLTMTGAAMEKINYLLAKLDSVKIPDLPDEKLGAVDAPYREVNLGYV